MTQLSQQEIIIIACIVGVVLLFILGLALWYFCSKKKEPSSAVSGAKYDTLTQDEVEIKEAEDIEKESRGIITISPQEREPMIDQTNTNPYANGNEFDAKDVPKGAHRLISVEQAINNHPQHKEPVTDYELQYKETHLMLDDDDSQQQFVQEDSHVSLVEGILSYDTKVASHELENDSQPPPETPAKASGIALTPLGKADDDDEEEEEQQEEARVFVTGKAVKHTMAANHEKTPRTENKTNSNAKHVQKPQVGGVAATSLSMKSDPEMVIVNSSYKREIEQFEQAKRNDEQKQRETEEEEDEKEEHVQETQATASKVRESVEDMMLTKADTMQMEDDVDRELEVEDKQIMHVINGGQQALSVPAEDKKQREDEFHDEYDIDTLDKDTVKPLKPQRLQTTKSDISISASTRSVLSMDSDANLFGDRFDRGGFEFDEDGEALQDAGDVDEDAGKEEQGASD